jgi:2-amino-4-hydroxy-6-hydroxymethyldihydropteridine diphosphokinase
MREWIPVLIAIGSNIERERNLPQAIVALGQQPDIELRAVSPIYESVPVGATTAQPPYFNAAALIKTSLPATALKDTVLAIEASQGRVRTADKFAARPIDLDIALYGQQVLELNGRHIPDPDIGAFPHVAVPLADLAPSWVHPELGLTLAEIAGRFSGSYQGVSKIQDFSVIDHLVTDAGIVTSNARNISSANGDIPTSQLLKGDELR